MLTTIIITILNAAAGAGIAWIFGRSKAKVEVAKIKEETAQLYLKNVEEAVNLWRGIAKDLETQVANLTGKCQTLSREIEALRKENKELKETYVKFEEAINAKAKQ